MIPSSGHIHISPFMARSYPQINLYVCLYVHIMYLYTCVSDMSVSSLINQLSLLGALFLFEKRMKTLKYVNTGFWQSLKQKNCKKKWRKKSFFAQTLISLTFK